MKKLLIFLAGFVMGMLAVNLYELFGVPAMPDDDYHEWTEDELLGVGKLFTPDELDELASIEDTQPIYIGADDELCAWKLDGVSE